MTFKKLLFIIAIMLSAMQVVARDGFAIVIDPKSHREAQQEVAAYAQAIEQCHGFRVYLVEDRWGVPDSIRQALYRLYTQKQDPIIGAVLIGDIPVAMVRDAQHLTSAFKMVQTQPRQASSVPSDRFYDDFGLRFTYIDRDTDAPYFYYSLTADSRQRTQPSIISGRIRPTDSGGTSRYDKLRAYLKKATAAKHAPRRLEQLFFFSGHGYISESKVARMDERMAYFEHFPTLRQRTNALSYMDHTDANPVKERLMNELMRPDLDLAILHHHGSPTTQYLNGTIRPYTVREAKAYIMRNLRDHIYKAYQRGQNYDSLQTALLARFDLPTSWAANALSDSLYAVDSAYVAASDLHLEDFACYDYRPNAPVVVIDACYCGSFHQEGSIANAYIFQPGATISVLANTVNALQDKWSDRFIGLLNQGGYVGDLVRYAHYLEAHCIGDPTYRFVNETPHFELYDAYRHYKPAQWRKLLAQGTPDQQSVAIEHLHQHKAITSQALLDIYKTSPHGLIRLQALTALADHANEDYITALILASQDAFELVQRLAVRRMGSSGDERLIPALMRLAVANNTSPRVNFDVGMTLSSFRKEALLTAFYKQFDSLHYVRKDSVRHVIERGIMRAADRITTDVEKALLPDATAKDRRSAIRATRNVMVHHLVPRLITLAETTDDEALQHLIIEALGWHPTSIMREPIREACQRIHHSNRYSESVRTEALKTYNRLNLY